MKSNCTFASPLGSATLDRQSSAAEEAAKWSDRKIGLHTPETVSSPALRSSLLARPSSRPAGLKWASSAGSAREIQSAPLIVFRAPTPCESRLSGEPHCNNLLPDQFVPSLLVCDGNRSGGPAHAGPHSHHCRAASAPPSIIGRARAPLPAHVQQPIRTLADIPFAFTQADESCRPPASLADKPLSPSEDDSPTFCATFRPTLSRPQLLRRK